MNALEQLRREVEDLRRKYDTSIQYIRAKTNQLLKVMGTSALRPEELDDATLIETDPIGIVSNSFVHVLRHLHKTNAKLKFANDEIKAIFDSVGMGILVVDNDMRVTSYNKMLKNQFFPDKDNITGQYCHESICGNIDDTTNCPFKKIFKTGTDVHHRQWELQDRHFDVVGTPVKDDDNNVLNAVLVYLEITDRIVAEQKLRRSEEKYRDLFENASDLIQSVGPDGSILYVNRAWHETLRYSEEEVSRLSIFDIIDPECANCGPDFKGVVCGDRAGRIETTFITKTREKIIVEGNVSTITDDGKFAGTRGIFRDITDKRRVESEMQRMQKLESLGLLAGGLAHDFNNLLTGIMGNISFAKYLMDPDHKAYDRLTTAEKATERATHLTRQLLTFAKGGTPVKTLTNIEEIARESIEFSISGSNVECEYGIADDLWSTEVDKGQMAQVFNNLTLNALHAMPNGGNIRVYFDNVTLREHQLPTILMGDYVQIRFTDNGVGIPKEDLARIFDPYFTTKEMGSGLGLATVYSIIQKHAGYITVQSKDSKGTTFYIYLPASHITATKKDTSKEPRTTTGSGRVLIMDDDAIIRELAGGMLTSLGYEVSFAEDGETAILSYKQAMDNKTPFNIVILDLTVPGGMGGKEAVRKILETDPDAKIIVSSGYSTDPVMSEYKKHGFCGVVTKPYTIDRLSGTISTVLSLQS
jgi:PAS domain S-box-containing protein